MRPKLVGSETPRVFTPPLRKLTPKSSLGFAFCQFAEDVVGAELIPYQRWLAIHMLELLPDGSPRFRTVLLLIARQNGKSFFLQLLSLFAMYVLGVRLVIGTAQNLDVAEEQWEGAVELAEESVELAPLIEQVLKVNGKKQLKLATGERYKVAAASRRGGRGLSGDQVILDELREHQSWDAWAAVTKTTMARPNALVVGASNAGDAASVVLRHLRAIAHDALGDPDGFAKTYLDLLSVPDDVEDLGDDSLGIFEWSARPDRGVWDRDGWVEANPALGYFITERAIASAARTDPEWVFRTEILCQWASGVTEGVFPAGAWERTADPDSEIVGKFVFGVAVSYNRGFSSIAAAGLNAAGQIHFEVAADRAGVDWVAPWLAERAGTPDLDGVVYQAAGAPVSALADDIAATGIPIIGWGGSDLAAAHGQFYDAVVAGAVVRPPGQELLDQAAETARMKPLGGVWVWDSKNSPNDVSPLEAATAAVWAARRAPVEASRSAYEDSGLVVL